MDIFEKAHFSSQKEKDKHCILTRIYGNYKNGTNEAVFWAGIETQTQRRALWTQKGQERVGWVSRVALKPRNYRE